MIKNLTRRVEYLEQSDSRFQPVGERMIMNVQFVDQDLKVVDQLKLTLAPRPNGLSGEGDAFDISYTTTPNRSWNR